MLLSQTKEPRLRGGTPGPVGRNQNQSALGVETPPGWKTASSATLRKIVKDSGENAQCFPRWLLVVVEYQ